MDTWHVTSFISFQKRTVWIPFFAFRRSARRKKETRSPLALTLTVGRKTGFSVPVYIYSIAANGG